LRKSQLPVNKNLPGSYHAKTGSPGGDRGKLNAKYDPMYAASQDFAAGSLVLCGAIL
jgi:hypothetical protein